MVNLKSMADDGRMHHLRPDIAESWHRVNLAGLDPTAPFKPGDPIEVDESSALLVGAAPVLDELETSLKGSKYSTLLVDRECRIVRRWFDDRRIEEGFDALNLRPGASVLEEAIGTNALGTVMETRRAISINGSEHFAQSLRNFSCYGHPIRHPLTKRIEGVLDISAIMSAASPLLPPLISRAVHDIEQRLLDGSRTSEKSLLAAFQAAAGTKRRAIVAIGEDILLSNQSAADLLTPGDIALLRVLTEEPTSRREQTLELSLSSGRAVLVHVTKVGGARDGALLQVEPCSPDRARSVTSRSELDRDTPAAPILVAGVPGSGRTTRARDLATRKPVKFLSPAFALLEGAESWAQDFQAAMRRRSGSVCVDGIDLLPDELLDVVIEAASGAAGPQLIFTSGPIGGLEGRAAALAGMATTREELLPLSVRRREIPGIARTMLRSLGADESLHITPSAIQALSAQTWPGNLRELKAVMEHASRQRKVGGLTIDDLPEQYRSLRPAAPMAALDQAERDVIVMALRNAGGNKVKAAQELGVSRTTLYARMRSLRISSY
ncbi:MAG: helix-turn-helix domain-containing protein [Aeromicrobium sp.]|uniref:sigma-54-dependent Fis family transcriptional regulator n=1 Tax=Aeromicrobium sp. TaxID=1871063 RepID=UPI00260C2D9C|nr:helix-turn-helix domain-containing protein [Aeromicrobium sp.]MDF1706411.1 helix-turn-helix domain-containing protein [Aeromicrobium sp.]